MTIEERKEGIEKLVEQHIYVCQSVLVEAAFNKQLFSIDDITNLYRPFDALLIKPNTCIDCNEAFKFLDSETGTCEECFEDKQIPQEIYEWWLVSPWLSKKLLLEGQPILDNKYGVWWGRCTTGQAIILDYFIQRIHDDLAGI